MALRSDWNFQNDVAGKLERIALSRLGFTESHTIPHLVPFFSSDEISSGTFAQVMIFLLVEKFKKELSMEDNGLEHVSDFINDCAEYHGLRSCEIEKDIADNLLNKFLRIYNE